jgi:hypothetical protein
MRSKAMPGLTLIRSISATFRQISETGPTVADARRSAPGEHPRVSGLTDVQVRAHIAPAHPEIRPTRKPPYVGQTMSGFDTPKNAHEFRSDLEKAHGEGLLARIGNRFRGHP